MKETLSWTLGGVLASFALLSLAATGGRASAPQAPRPIRVAALSAARDPAGDVPPALFAEAYFDLARAEPGVGARFDDWFIRHEITVKGVAAQSGETPEPEDPDLHKLSVADQHALTRAEQTVEEWRARLRAAHDPNARAELVGLTAALQVRYDWWLLLAEAKAPIEMQDKARDLYEDTRAALLGVAQRNEMAAL